MNEKKLAQEILEFCGGKNNIRQVSHCMTRLRVTLVDESLFQKEDIANLAGIKGISAVGNQKQIILGMGTVDRVCEEFSALSGRSAEDDNESSEEGSKENFLKRGIKTLSDIFIPIIPILVAIGFITGLVGICIYPGYFDKNLSLVQLYPSFSGIAEILNLFANSILLFLPIFIAYTATKKFGGNPFIGIALAVTMVNPNLINPTAVGIDIPNWNFFGLQIPQIGYQQTVLPVIASSFLAAKVDNWLKIKLPRIFGILSSGITLVIVGLITFLLIGPILRSCGYYLSDGLVWLYTNTGVLGGAIFGLLYIPCVITGMHHSFIPIEIQLVSDIANTGGTFILPIAAMSNVAAGGAALAIWFLTKNTDLKTESSIAGVTAILGASEPAIFGVLLKYRAAFIATLTASAIGGAIMALFQVRARGMGAGGVMGYLFYEPKVLLIYTIGMLIACTVSFVLTVVMVKGNFTREAELM